MTQEPLMTTLLFKDTRTTQIYSASLHDALPISPAGAAGYADAQRPRGVGTHRDRLSGAAKPAARAPGAGPPGLLIPARSEEHTSELQSRENLVCRLLLEKKKS